MDKTLKPLIKVVAALIEKDGRYLIAQRTSHATFPLHWEFPGGKVEQGETDEEALKREMMEELGIEVSVGALFEREVHCYDAFSVDFRVFRCEIVKGEPKALHCADFRFVTLEEMGSYRFPPADEKAIGVLLGLVGG
jgi:8-oxo-dGTP diphosphatase